MILMYNRTSTVQSLNQARIALFTQKGRSLENIPSTSATLIQHIKRAVYQAGYCWGQCLEPCPELPSPNEWGWKWSESQLWEPLRTTLPEASKACQELLKCRCNPEKGCSGQCKCVKAKLECTALCKCGGECKRNWKLLRNGARWEKTVVDYMMGLNLRVWLVERVIMSVIKVKSGLEMVSDRI